MRLFRSLTGIRSLAFAAVLALVGASAAHAADGATPSAPGGGVAHTGAAGTAYVALGDSYSSGVGAGGYESSSGDCKRSTKAYPRLWANANAPSSFSFTACSGARTDDVLAKQLGPLNSGTGLVSVTIGGNDAGFADTMTTCVLNSESTCLNRIAEARTYVTNTLPGKLDKVYSAITARSPAARVVVLGYPRFYKLNGSCTSGLSERVRTAINDAADLLNSVTAKRAADHGFTFGDVTPAFTGHEICSGDSWLHSVNWLNIGESYHPTAAGQSGGYHSVFRSAA
ncbi:SGNH/GDSL hydrolase family protein [Streptomyces sp. LX-29]|uniref:SGNH/GDSL hydrolase family protein n=1 Tax=Streptomyces sp. LX-29 TaxID=2900152 RepID=UPI00240D1F96|nr:SGNH/GDSL hydrolase family protein [Streptomyces sp. LX-29]WFB10310.1 SGNH/GDSL hydrolase family protein [Streptomyces sp. LX-29]